DIVLRRVEADTPANRIDRLEAAGGDEPRARVLRHAVFRPLLDRGAKRVLERLLREIEIAEHANQRREHAARFVPVDVLDDSADLRRAVRLHRSTSASSSYERSRAA